MIELKLTDEQAKIVSTACEFYARILMGQFGEIPYHCKAFQLSCNRDELEKAWLDLRKLIYPELNGPGHSYGRGKFQKADSAYDVHQVIRFAYGGPVPFSFDELPECRRVDNEGKKVPQDGNTEDR